jgi:Na+/H+ antiporter NhaC
MEKELKMRGGVWGGLVPLVILVIGLVWLSVAERGGTKPFWACGWIAIAVGLFFAREPKEYCLALMRGISDKTGIVVVTAWLFAGVFGELMKAGGLVEGLLWMGMTTGTTGATFVLLVFLAAMLFATGTGTSTGTCIALTPVLFPAGYFLGADPAMVALAILSGAAFGDNLAPVSDTTIVSAFTQGATMRDVVRTRFPLCIGGAVFAALVFLIFGGGGAVTALPEIKAQINPVGLVMLIGIAVVVVAALSGRHIVESLIYGNIAAAVLGMVTGKISIARIFSIPAKRGISTGLVEDGIQGVVGAVIFAILILAVTQVLVESGIMRRILEFAERAVVRTVRQAEAFIAGVTILVSIPISANAPALLLVGPSLVKPLGKKWGLAPSRRANLMDCAVCTLFFTLPWHIAVAAWYGAVYNTAQQYGIPAPPISTALCNPYSWTLLAVLIFSIMTGWNRKMVQPGEEDAGEAAG